MTETSRSPLKVAVVGHTNTGKTSLMRTLMRDAGFGEVAPSPATTRQVEGAALGVNGDTIVELYDTPGMEDAAGLYEALEDTSGERHAGPDRVSRFLESRPDRDRFEQEARVLSQMLAVEAALYVIDAREPVLGKYQDELAILALCARPILPVLNFVANPDNRAAAWREALARVNLHAVAEFDTVVFSLDAEARLWRQLATLVSHAEQDLGRLVESRRRQARWRTRAACRIVAELLIDAAACQRTAPADDAGEQALAAAELKQAIVKREQRGVDQLLALYDFSADDYAALDLPLEGGRWGGDLFDPTVLGHYAGRTGKTAGAGAVGGAAVDLALGGMSLGAGTIIGALAGTGAGVLRDFGGTIGDRLRGRIRIQAEPAAVDRLAWRNLQLVGALNQRGHASQAPMQSDGRAGPIWPGGRQPVALLKARLQPGVSALNGTPGESARQSLVEPLTGALESLLDTRRETTD